MKAWRRVLVARDDDSGRMCLSKGVLRHRVPRIASPWGSSRGTLDVEAKHGWSCVRRSVWCEVRGRRDGSWVEVVSELGEG